MAVRQFELRGWDFSGENGSVTPINVLGILWHKSNDMLSINLESHINEDRKDNKKGYAQCSTSDFWPNRNILCCCIDSKTTFTADMEYGTHWEKKSMKNYERNFWIGLKIYICLQTWKLLIACQSTTVLVKIGHFMCFLMPVKPHMLQ